VNSSSTARPGLWLILAMVSAGSMQFYVAKIWSANQPPYFTDLYAPWWGAHELLLHGRSPYAPEVAHEIQTEIYGAPAVAADSSDPATISGGFAYPVYAVLLLWPAAHLSFSTVQTLFLCFSVPALGAGLALWLRAFRFRPPLSQGLAAAFFALGSFPALQAIKLQNLSLIAALFIAATLALIASDHLILAGMFLAVSSFKPQFVVLLIPWLILWSLSDWRRRGALAWSFAASALSLIAAGELLLPGWIRGFLQVVAAYRHYTFGHSLLDLWFTPSVAPVASAVLVLATFAFCWRYRRLPANSPRFIITTSLMLAMTLLIIPTLAPHAQLLLLPGFLCLMRYRSVLWKFGRLARLVLVASWLLLAWPWAAAAGLMVVAVRTPIVALLRWWQVPLYTSPILPVGVLLALAVLASRRAALPERELEPLTR